MTVKTKTENQYAIKDLKKYDIIFNCSNDEYIDVKTGEKNDSLRDDYIGSLYGYYDEREWIFNKILQDEADRINNMDRLIIHIADCWLKDNNKPYGCDLSQALETFKEIDLQHYPFPQLLLAVLFNDHLTTADFEAGTIERDLESIVEDGDDAYCDLSFAYLDYEYNKIFDEYKVLIIDNDLGFDIAYQQLNK